VEFGWKCCVFFGSMMIVMESSMLM